MSQRIARRFALLSSYLSESFGPAAVLCGFLRFGWGMRHSIEKATQFVQGTPRLAASHRTCWGSCERGFFISCSISWWRVVVLYVNGKSVSGEAVSTLFLLIEPRQWIGEVRSANNTELSRSWYIPDMRVTHVVFAEQGQG